MNDATTNAPAAAVAAVAATRPKQNGQTRPTPGTLTGLVWDYADAITAQRAAAGEPHTIATIGEVKAYYEKVEGSQTSTCQAQYGRWVKFHNYGDLLKARRAAEKPVTDKDAEKAAKKAAKEAERAAKKAVVEAEKAAKKAAKEVERAAKKAATEAEKAARAAAKESEKAARKVAADTAAVAAASAAAAAAANAAVASNPNDAAQIATENAEQAQ